MAANNFILSVVGTGKYISKAGNDSNAGTSKDEPRKSLSSMSVAVNDENVVGTGLYQATRTGPTTSAAHWIRGDGVVIIDLGGTGIIGERASFSDITIKNGVWSSSTSDTRTFLRCVFNTITGQMVITVNPYNSKFDTCVLINFNCTSPIFSNVYTAILQKSILYGGSGLIQLKGCTNSYIGVGCVIQFNIVASGAVPTINDTYATSQDIVNRFCNCNINGLVRLPISGGLTQDYAIQDQYVGTPQANGYAAGVHWLNETNLTADGFIGTVSGWNAVVSTMINRDPKFNDAASYNFTLQSDSPHYKRAYNGTENIGGTVFAKTVINTDNGVNNIVVSPSAGINTSAPLAYTLPSGSEGYVDYMFYQSGTATKIDVMADLLFDSDVSGGSATNNDVIDADPLTSSYPTKVNTSGAAADTTHLVVPTGTIANGETVRVAGEVRTVTAISSAGGNDTLTVSAAFRAIVGSGVSVTHGTAKQISALNPNRLTILMRTSNNAITSPPSISNNADWDNNVAAGLGYTGSFFNQAIKTQPGLYISGGTVYGSGDSDAPTGLSLQQIGNCWIHARVYLRDNYSSTGL